MAFSLAVIILSLLLKWCQSAGCPSGQFCPKASALEAVQAGCTAPDPPTFVPSIKELAPEGYLITIKYQVPKNSGCDFLTAVDVLYRLKNQKEWKTVTADLSRDEVNIDYMGTGIYMVMMSATNNEGITSESEIKSIEVGKQNSEGDSTVAYIIAAVIVVVALAALIFGILVVRKRKRAKNTASSEVAGNIIVVPSAGRFTGAERIISTVIPVSDFSDYVHMQKDRIAKQFGELKRGYHTQPVIASSSKNKKKNIFFDVFPYDHNRVVLYDDGSDEGDYINASYIKGYGDIPKSYIATQAPVHRTIIQFWRMIWQNNVNRIVMLVNVTEEENDSAVCSAYWPSEKGGTLKCGDYFVTLTSQTEFAYFTARSIQLAKQGVSRTVFHFHFTCWPKEASPPLGALSLLSFHRMVHAKDAVSSGPLVVHCRAGIGRSGTYIALDILLQQMAFEKVVDVYGCVKKLREQRANMIPSKDQYFFLHDAILHRIITGDTACTVSAFLEKPPEVDEFSEVELSREYYALRTLLNEPLDAKKTGLATKNRLKNRELGVIPVDANRPHLLTQVTGYNDYINAVYVDSFRKRRRFIITQMPLPRTRVDFWRLVYDYNIQCIVMLNEFDESMEVFDKYWNDREIEAFGPITVQLTAFNQLSDDIVVREFSVGLHTNRPQNPPPIPLKVTHYQFLRWNIPVEVHDGRRLVPLLEMVHQWQKAHSVPPGLDATDTTIVQCMNGVTRSGIFCAALHAIEQITATQEVDLLLAARTVCTKRNQCFTKKDEYYYLFTCIHQYIKLNC